MLIGNRFTGIRRIPEVQVAGGRTAKDRAIEKFFTHQLDGLDISDALLLEALKGEIPGPSDFAWMTDEELEDVKRNLATSIKDGEGNSTRSHKVSVRTLKRMKAVAKAFTFLGTIRRNISDNEMKWTNISSFIVEYEALEKIAAAPAPSVPKYRKDKGWLIFMHDMQKFLSRVYGCQMAPLAYLIIGDHLRDESLPGSAEYKPLISGKFYSAEFPRISEMLLARAPRDTSDAEADSETLYNYLAEALTGTAAESMLDEFSKSRDGVGLWQRISDTQLTPSAYEAECQKHLKWLMGGGTWNGPQDGPLDDYVNKHRRQHDNYVRAGEKISAQKFDDHTRVGWMIGSIHSDDPAIIVRVQNIRDDDNDKRKNFESAAVYLSKCEYVGKHAAGKKRKKSAPEADVGSASGGSSGGGQGGINGESGSRGKSGVVFRWYPKPEFKKLPKDQQAELLKWRATNGISAKAQRQAKKSKKEAGKKTVSHANRKKAISDIASIAASLPDGEQRAQLESILSSVGAEVGSVAIDQSAPTGEDDQPSNDQAGDAIAEVGGSSVSNEVGDQVDEDLKRDVESQLAVAAALGTQRMIKPKKDGGKSGGD